MGKKRRSRTRTSNVSTSPLTRPATGTRPIPDSRSLLTPWSITPSVIRSREARHGTGPPTNRRLLVFSLPMSPVSGRPGIDLEKSSRTDCAHCPSRIGVARSCGSRGAAPLIVEGAVRVFQLDGSAQNELEQPLASSGPAGRRPPAREKGGKSGYKQARYPRFVDDVIGACF